MTAELPDSGAENCYVKRVYDRVLRREENRHVFFAVILPYDVSLCNSLTTRFLSPLFVLLANFRFGEGGGGEKWPLKALSRVRLSQSELARR